MRRLSILSDSNQVDIYKSLPTLDDNRVYNVKIEQLSLPKPVHDSVFETELLTLERRILRNQAYNAGVATINESKSFTPVNCKTVEDLVYQLNRYLRYSISVDLMADWPGNPSCNPQEHVAYEDWYSDVYTRVEEEKDNDTLDYRDSVQAFIRRDGRLYIMFSPFGIKHYVLRLTDKAKEIFGHDYDYFAPDVADNTKDKFNHEYLTALGAVALASPTDANIQGSVSGGMKNNLYHHELYRDEIVIETSLPFQNHMFANTNEIKPTPMLASFRLTQDHRETQYTNTMLKTHHVTSYTRYNLADGCTTHNTFQLTHSKLQNFHLRLLQRSYEYDSEDQSMKAVDKPYVIPEGNIWMLRLTVE